MWPMLKKKNCNTGTTRGSHDVWCFPYLFLLIATYKVSKTPCGPVSLASHRLVYAMSAWSVKTRRAPSRHFRDVRVYGDATTTTHELSTSPLTVARVCNIFHPYMASSPPPAPSGPRNAACPDRARGIGPDTSSGPDHFIRAGSKYWMSPSSPTFRSSGQTNHIT